MLPQPLVEWCTVRGFVGTALVSVGSRLLGVRRLVSPGWIVSHLFVVAMVALMTNLGFWQLRRLDERRVTNEATILAMSQEPLAVLRYLDQPQPPPDHTAVTATGTYLADREVLIANRSSNGLPGSWLATPLRLTDGRIVVVVRGWISRRSLVGSSADLSTGAALEGTVTVTGLLFDSLTAGRVAVTDPDDKPEISRMDLTSYEQASGLAVEDLWIRLRQQTPPQPEGLPVPVPDPELGDGPHLSYAFQWFFFSLGTVVVYTLILRRFVLSRTGVAPRPDQQLPDQQVTAELHG